ncbi:MAG TPA: ornithine cyclodeaminase family protein [Methylomirabilota bacterium]|nr:ornithine cyclodeaminase family protein [Methylomirabilota bacterium]
MTLHISESEVRALLTMPAAIDAVEEISRRQASGEALVHARRRIELGNGGFFHYMAGADFTAGFIAMKLYTFVRGNLGFLVPLYWIETGELAALIEADYMGQMRTGAASGVATKYLARREARTAAIIGTGGQARTQLQAVAAVRKLEWAKAYGRDPERRERFCREMAQRIGVPVRAAASSTEALHGADIVCTATTASRAVLNGADLAAGTHVNAIGANHAHKRELDDEAVRRAGVTVVDSIEQSRQEAGDLILAFGGNESRWSAVQELHQIVAKRGQGRSSEGEITLFKSNGIAVWDTAVAIRVFQAAREKGIGRELPLWSEKPGRAAD